MKIMKDMKKISPGSMNSSADLKKNKITMFGVGILPLCPAPSIGDAAGLKRADCLTPPQAGEFPRAPAAATGRCSKHRAGRQGVRRSEAHSNRQIVSTRASLTTPHGGTRRRFIDWLDDAQGSPEEAAGHGRLKPVTPRRDWFVFFHVEENEQ